MTIIAGIDPDTKAITIAKAAGASVQVQRVEAKGRLAEDRFAQLIAEVTPILDGLTNASWVYIEKPMLTRNAKSTLDQALVVGAIRALCLTRGLKHSLVDPGVWKRALLGNGHASKEEIRDWAMTAFTGISPNLPQDAYDAACIARFGLERFTISEVRR